MQSDFALCCLQTIYINSTDADVSRVIFLSYDPTILGETGGNSLNSHEPYRCVLLYKIGDLLLLFVCVISV